MIGMAHALSQLVPLLGIHVVLPRNLRHHHHHFDRRREHYYYYDHIASSNFSSSQSRKRHGHV